MTTDDNKLTRQVAIRLSDDDMTRLDALAETIPIASRNAIARAALRLGIAALEADLYWFSVNATSGGRTSREGRGARSDVVAGRARHRRHRGCDCGDGIRQGRSRGERRLSGCSRRRQARRPSGARSSALARTELPRRLCSAGRVS